MYRAVRRNEGSASSVSCDCDEGCNYFKLLAFASSAATSRRNGSRSRGVIGRAASSSAASAPSESESGLSAPAAIQQGRDPASHQ